MTDENKEMVTIRHDSSTLNCAKGSSVKDHSSFQDKKNELLRQMTVLLLFSLDLKVEIRNDERKMGVI
ncbi:MAG: hypothetical protein HYV59_09820 [Planctomycetes bacterium]|nr:hypothetical protein [Planctomycetota bacterium]